MKRRGIICVLFCSSLFFLTGCWDRKEMEERSIWLATGLDAAGKEDDQLSGQIIVPSKVQTQKGSGGGKAFVTISAVGKNLSDTVQNIQRKYIREIFYGHRRVILFGETFAKRGLKNKLDNLVRYQESSLRAGAMVVKGGTAKEILSLSNPIENIPVEAFLKAPAWIKGAGDTSFLHFLIAANSDGIRPILPAIEIGNMEEGRNGQRGPKGTKIFRAAGSAIFDKNLKLRGFLNIRESSILLWTRGIQKKLTLTIPVKNGNASLFLVKMKHKIVPEISKNSKIKFTIILSGEGDLLENNTNLEPIQSKNLKLLQNDLENPVEKEAIKTIKKLQKDFGTDSFGLGEVIREKDPNKWKGLKKNWDKHFSEADILVKVHLVIRRVGMSGPSILYKESEIVK